MIDVLTTSSVSQGILSWTEAIEDPREPLEAIRIIVRADIAKRFDSETDPWGAAWLPRSITTFEIRRARGQNPTPRRFTSRSRTTEGGKGIAIGFGDNPSARRFHVGNPTNRVFGRGLGRIPPRALLPIRGDSTDLPDAMRDDVMEAFRAEFLEAVRRRSGG